MALTGQIDKQLTSIFSKAGADKKCITTVALGGYGRKELSFSSDIDVLFLIENEDNRQSAEPAIENILHMLLELSLDIGHGFRTIDECLKLAEENIESGMSLFESRFVCGDRNLFKKLISAVRKKVDSDDPRSFLQMIADLREARYSKYGNSSKLLEPNIKNSVGGLRDLHTSFWLLCGTRKLRIPLQIEGRQTTTLYMLNSELPRKQFTPSFLSETRTAFDTLLRIRNEMHLLSKTRHDTLEFDFQPKIASGLHYRSGTKRAKVEHFMQDYYKASRCIARLCSRIINRVNDVEPENPSEKRAVKLNGNFVIRNKKIHMTGRRTVLSNDLLLRTFLIRSERRSELSFKLEDNIHRKLPSIKPLSGRQEANLFQLLINRPNGVGSSLMKMNELGILERWIPEWKPMVSFFQHNQYHYYTADEHTLIALANAEALEHSNSLFGNVFRSLPRRDILYFSCLMHDIAKPLNIRRHAVKGVPISRKVLRRLRYYDIVDDVAFLVGHHLLMEQIAFRRNLNDYQTIVEFAGIFDRPEQLDYLFVLTYADLSAVNRNVLTEWKELLLCDLYTKAHAILKNEMTTEEAHEYNLKEVEEKRAEIVHKLVPEFPPEEVEEHLQSLSDANYPTVFKPEEIVSHLLAIRRNERVITLYKSNSGFTEVTFIAHDERGLLSKLCGVLTANDANILDAQIFTRHDGIIIDRFRVVQYLSHDAISKEICDRISHDIRKVLNGSTDIAHLIEKYRKRWKRYEQPMRQSIRCDVVFEDHPKFTIIDIYSPDTLGFLYSITDALSRIGLNITFAKIATRMDSVVDSFYILDENGNKLDDQTRRSAVREEILSAIRKVTT